MPLLDNALQTGKGVIVALTFCLCSGTTVESFAQGIYRLPPLNTDIPAFHSLDDSPTILGGGPFRTAPTNKSPSLNWLQRITALAQGRTQLQGGYSFLYDSSGKGSGTQHAFPDLLLRFGFTERIEFRLGWPGFVGDDLADTAFGTGSDVLVPNVGLLCDLWCQHGPLPQTAVLVAVPLTMEGSPFAFNSLQPLTELMYSWEINHDWAITGRSGIALFDLRGDHFAQFQQTVSLDTILNERLGAFASWEMLIDQGRQSSSSQHVANVGASFLVKDNLAINCRVGAGISAPAPDFLYDIGFAYSF